MIDFAQFLPFLKWLVVGGITIWFGEKLVKTGRLQERERRHFDEKTALRTHINYAESEKDRLEKEIKNLKGQQVDANNITDDDRRALWEASGDNLTVHADVGGTKKPTRSED